MISIPHELHPLLAQMAISPEQIITWQPLTGGIASDVWLLETAQQKVCIKRALRELRVTQSWQVDTNRNAYEVLWFESVANFFPDCVPKILAHDQTSASFAMSYFPAEDFPVWKSLLSAGQVFSEQAVAVAHLLGKIHQYSARLPEMSLRFDNHETFYQIRIEPYFLATAKKHPEYAEQIRWLAEELAKIRLALVHGDVSPKNILMGKKAVIFLDAECAVYGDPAFDLAFLLNHLLLKSLLCKNALELFIKSFEKVFVSYMPYVDWEDPLTFEMRLQNYLGVFLLARIDGKSPVEYIGDDKEKNFVREQGKWLLDLQDIDVLGMGKHWQQQFKKTF
jgi:aminoglycoside phosphotransferase (APT) family kinase protein